MTSPVDISPSQLEIVYNILHKYLPSNIRVWVFGSRAKWTTHDGSDLDLAVEGDHPVDRTTMINLSTAFDDSDLPYTVDVVDLKAVSNQFKKIIDEQKIPMKMNNTSWHEMPVSEVATAIIGGTPSRTVPDYWHGNIQWATAKDIAKNNSRYLYKSQESITDMGLSKSSAKIMPKNTILITSRGTVGALTQLGKEMTFNQTCYALVPNERIDADYLYYALKNTRSQMEALTYGTIFQTITTKSFKEWHIPIPPLDKQRAIAHILGTLDAKIDLNHKMSRVLEDMVRTLFKSWFVDFDPVRAKMDGYWKQGKSLPGMPAHLYDLFPGTLVDSELGKIPKGWDIRSLDMIANFQNGLALQNFRPSPNENRLPVVKIAQLRKGSVDNKEWAKENMPSKCIIDDGDVVFSWSASLLVKIWCGGRAALNQHLFKVTSLNYPKWLYLSYIEHHLQKFQNIASDKTTSIDLMRNRHIFNEHKQICA